MIYWFSYIKRKFEKVIVAYKLDIPKKNSYRNEDSNCGVLGCLLFSFPHIRPIFKRKTFN